jgi:hypothetical protein
MKRTEPKECAMCKRMIPPEKRINSHHLSYRNSIVVDLCFICHSVVHGRLKFHNPYDKYGVDYGAVYMAEDIMKLYKPVYAEIQEFKVGGFPEKTSKRKKGGSHAKLDKLE